MRLEMTKKSNKNNKNIKILHLKGEILKLRINILTDHTISARRPDIIIIKKKKKKRNLQNCRLCCPCRPQDKYFDIARKKLCNMKVTITPIVIDTVTKGLLKGLEELEVGGRVETIQIIALLRPVRILRRVLVT